MSPTIHMEELQRAFIARGSAEKGAAIEYLDRIKMQRHDLELAQKQQSRNNTKNALIRQQIKNDIDQNHANELINSEVLIQTEKDRIITLQYYLTNLGVYKSVVTKMLSRGRERRLMKDTQPYVRQNMKSR